MKQNFLFLELFLASCLFFFFSVLFFFSLHRAELCKVTARDFRSAVSRVAVFLPNPPGQQGCFWVPWPSTPAAPRLLGTPRAVGAAPGRGRSSCQRTPAPALGDGVAGKSLCRAMGKGRNRGGSRKNAGVWVSGDREALGPWVSVPWRVSGPAGLPTRECSPRERSRIQPAWLGDRSHWARHERQAWFKMKFKKIAGRKSWVVRV